MSIIVKILSAGFNRKEFPSGQNSMNNEYSVLEWQLKTFRAVNNKFNFKVAVGYKSAELLEQYPYLNIIQVPGWEENSALSSFQAIEHSNDKPVVSIYGDTVFHPQTIKSLLAKNADLVVVVDSVWKERFNKRPVDDIAVAEVLETTEFGDVEFTGLIKFSPRALKVIGPIIEQLNEKTFLTLIKHLEEKKFNIAYIDVCGSWAEMNEEEDLVQFILGNKAETLERVAPYLSTSDILKQITISRGHWNSDRFSAINLIQNSFSEPSLIIRSSSNSEDSWTSSAAGKFESILGVNRKDKASIEQAVSSVFKSYKNNNFNEIVLIQPYIERVQMAGVVMTCDIDTGAPYYTVNYDTSGSSNSITSGITEDTITVKILKDQRATFNLIDQRLKPIIVAVKEIEKLLNYNKLDIEFALDWSGKVYIFQIRPIVSSHQRTYDIYPLIKAAENEFKNLQAPSFNCFGDFTMFSGMTDWNPAEILGVKPKPLAASLYKYLITDNVWALQRYQFGYKNLGQIPLLRMFCGQPYIDCRASINSFIPKKLSKNLTKRLVTAYLKILQKKPYLHDKIETAVVFTIWTPNFFDRAHERFSEYNISDKDLEIYGKALKDITEKAFIRLHKDISPIRKMIKRRKKILRSDISNFQKAFELLIDCKHLGTLSFAHAARAGFVSASLLESFVEEGVLTKSRLSDFYASLSTVLGDLQKDMMDPSFDKKSIVEKYGHLRPGTYDIGKKAYWEDPEFYFADLSPEAQKSYKIEKKQFNFNKKEIEAFEKFLLNFREKISVKEFISYLRRSIQYRELMKFYFSKNLSLALDLIYIAASKGYNLSRDRISYLTMSEISDFASGSFSKRYLEGLIDLRKKEIQNLHLSELPIFINNENEFWAFKLEKAQINFVTQSSVIADGVFMAENDDINLGRKIVIIPHADPGYDWLFSKGIAGFISKLGGANSHMAIRCAELGIPAAIGVGSLFYSTLRSGRIHLDCKNRTINYV